MPFLPRGFVIPEPPATDQFMLTSLRVDHLVLDYEAVMSSRERLWQLFGPGWGWPRADMTLMQDLVDLGWHQKEFQLRRSFNHLACDTYANNNDTALDINSDAIAYAVLQFAMNTTAINGKRAKGNFKMPPDEEDDHHGNATR